MKKLIFFQKIDLKKEYLRRSILVSNYYYNKMLTRSQSAKSSVVKESTNNITYNIMTRSRSRMTMEQPQSVDCKEQQVRRSLRISKLPKPVEYDEEPARRSMRISKLPKPLYEVDISFEESHEAWMVNKKKLENGMYKYLDDYIRTYVL